MSEAEQIRNLEDLVNRVSRLKDFSVHADNRDEASHQFKFLLQIAARTEPSGKSELVRKDLECFHELESLVQKAESKDIAGSKEARVEFDNLVMGYRSAGCPLYKRKINLSLTVTITPGYHVSQSTLENEKEVIKHITSHKAPKGTSSGSRSPAPRRGSPDVHEARVSKEEYDRLIKSEEMLKAQVEELTARLSKVASDKLNDNNPNIADLSDQNRPTKIGERFGELYDNEWSEAFEELKKHFESEKEILHMLLHIIQLCQWFCVDVAEQQLERLGRYMKTPLTEIKWIVKDVRDPYYAERPPDDPTALSTLSTKTAREYRKSAATASLPALCVMFKDLVYRAEFNVDYNKNPGTENYVDECVKCVWLMCVQEPPMRLVWQKKDEQVDLDQFRFYERKGKVVEQCVWPAVLLYEGGPLVSKGYVLPQQAQGETDLSE